MNRKLNLSFIVIVGFVCLFAFSAAIYGAIQVTIGNNRPTSPSGEQKAETWCHARGGVIVATFLCADPATHLVYWAAEVNGKNPND